MRRSAVTSASPCQPVAPIPGPSRPCAGARQNREVPRVKADPAVQRRLLELADVDAELSRVDHQRRTLPELAEIAEAEKTVQAKRDAKVANETALGDLDREVKRQEKEIDAVRAREDRDRGLLAGGTVNAKQMTDLEHELAHVAAPAGHARGRAARADGAPRGGRAGRPARRRRAGEGRGGAGRRGGPARPGARRPGDRAGPQRTRERAKLVPELPGAAARAVRAGARATRASARRCCVRGAAARAASSWTAA